MYQDEPQCANVATEAVVDRARAQRVLGLDAPKPAVSRARLKELFALAYETVQWLEAKGLKKGEQCEFREIAERLWWKD